MPWLDTGVESTIKYSQICPGWIQESNLELVVYRYALAGYRYGSATWWVTDVPSLDAGIESSNSSDVPWLDTGVESGNVVNRYALAGYRSRIRK